jgi:hypothetical protein
MRGEPEGKNIPIEKRIFTYPLPSGQNLSLKPLSPTFPIYGPTLSHLPQKTALSLMNYARRRSTLADLIKERGRTLTVELPSGKRTTWTAGKHTIEIIEFGSLNPNEPNYIPGGKILRTI